MLMVMLVLDQPELLDEVLDAWRDAGVSGVTVTESEGSQRRAARQSYIPARYALGGMVPSSPEGNFTLWTVVPDERMARRCLEAAELILGDLDDPNNGVMAVWPLLWTKGVPGGSGPER
jgi:nitrogen regulatory protein PII